jgi:hypothetical protein
MEKSREVRWDIRLIAMRCKQRRQKSPPWLDPEEPVLVVGTITARIISSGINH